MPEQTRGSDTETDADTETSTADTTGQTPSPARAQDQPLANGEPDLTPQGARSAVPLGIFHWVIKYAWIALFILMLLSVLFGLFLPLAAYYYTHVLMDEPKLKPPVVHSAGRVLSVTQEGGFFTRALVETDSAYYSLLDGVSLKKGEALTQEDRGPREQFLCDSQHHCQKLVPFADKEQGQ